MKFVIAFVFASCLSASAQLTNITALLQSVPKGHQACITNYFYVAEAQFKPTAMKPTNTWYYPTTNIITATCTNPNVMIVIGSSFLAQKCSIGTLVYTNPVYPDDTFRFGVFWSNNVVPPTNQLISLSVTGIRTNSP